MSAEIRRSSSGPSSPAAFHYRPGHMILHGNPAFIETFGPSFLGQPAREAPGFLPKAFDLMHFVYSTGKPGACAVTTPDG